MLGRGGSRTLTRKYNSWVKSLPQKQMRNYPKIFEERVDAEVLPNAVAKHAQASPRPQLIHSRLRQMMVDVCVPRYYAALDTLAQSSAKQARTCSRYSSSLSINQVRNPRLALPPPNCLSQPRVFVVRMMRRPGTVFDKPKFGDVIILWSPLRDTNEFR